jgi:hypothetical protein
MTPSAPLFVGSLAALPAPPRYSAEATDQPRAPGNDVIPLEFPALDR